MLIAKALLVRIHLVHASDCIRKAIGSLAVGVTLGWMTGAVFAVAQTSNSTNHS